MKRAWLAQRAAALLAVCTACGTSSAGPGFAERAEAGASDAAGARRPADASGDGYGNFGELEAGHGIRDADCTLACSSDLHEVIDCSTGSVVQTCAPDQGCVNAACVDACAAAVSGQTTVGCEYFVHEPNTDIYSGCFVAFVANTWGSPVTITVDYAGTPITDYLNYIRTPSGSGPSLAYSLLGGSGNTLPAGQVAILFLSGTICVPGVTSAYATQIDAAGSNDTGLYASTRIGNAFHIATDRPVVAYSNYPYKGGQFGSWGATATLLTPTSAWDTNYVAVDAYRGEPNAPSNSGNPWVSVVAQTDGTNVTISPTVAIAEAQRFGVPGTAAGMPHTWTLQRGQAFEFDLSDPSAPPTGDYTGSPIQADHPVAVFGGISSLNIPETLDTAGLGWQQIPPVHLWGHEYVYARYQDRYLGRPESPPVRIVGAVDGTTLVYDPAPPAGAPSTLAARQMVEFTASGPFAVKSQDAQHPFYMAAYMTGCGEYSGNVDTDCRGAPTFVNVAPPQAFLNQYTFFTDPTFPRTELVVVRTRDENGQWQAVDLDCLGPISGWQMVDSAAKYEFAQVDLVMGNFVKNGSCDNGVHSMSSNAAFGVTVWGWGSATSYAYPAGTSAKPLTTVVVPPTPQ
jgi:hypothetical protein